MLRCSTDTAVVILSYNGKLLHKDFLPGIIAEAKDQYDVIVVDNASEDDTYDYVGEHFPTVKRLQHKTNNGFAQGYQDALMQIEAKYYVLLSADFEVSPGWFEPLHRMMQADNKLAAIQPKIKYQKQKDKFEYAGAGGGFMDKWGYMFCRGRIFFDLEEDKGQYDDNIESFWASGGCFFVRAELFHEYGGLDTSFYAHMEEIDLCWRLKNAGYRIGYCGESTVYHVGGSVISYGSPQKLFYNYRNSLALLYKNEEGSRLWWLLPWRLILDGLSAVRSLVSGDFKGFWAALRAHFSFYSMLPALSKKRREYKKKVGQRNKTGIYQKSIVWEYFAGKKKVFSDLETGDLVKKL